MAEKLVGFADPISRFTSPNWFVEAE